MEVSLVPTQLTRFSHRYETGSQPMMIYGSNGNLYVVKFAERAERGTAGLAREYVAGSLAELIDAPVPSTTFVELTSGSLTIDPNIAFADGSRPAPQVTVGSTFISNTASPASPKVFQTVPAQDIAGVLVFNTWVSVGDRHWGNYIIERQIRDTIGRVPGTWMATDEREQIVSFLMSGRVATARLVGSALA